MEETTIKEQFKIIGRALITIIKLIWHRLINFIDKNAKGLVRLFILLFIAANVVWIIVFLAQRRMITDAKDSSYKQVDSLQQIIDCLDSSKRIKEEQDSIDRVKGLVKLNELSKDSSIRDK